MSETLQIFTTGGEDISTLNGLEFRQQPLAAGRSRMTNFSDIALTLMYCIYNVFGRTKRMTGLRESSSAHRDYWSKMVGLPRGFPNNTVAAGLSP